MATAAACLAGENINGDFHKEFRLKLVGYSTPKVALGLLPIVGTQLSSKSSQIHGEDNKKRKKNYRAN